MTNPGRPAIMGTMRHWLVALPLGLGACAGGGSITVPRPAGLAPGSPEAAAEWARATLPDDSREIRFRWQIRDDRGAAGGRGRVRWALPDSARLDVAGPLGSGRAAAFVAGDTALWAQPEEDVERLVPNFPLFWALLGVVREPAPGASVRTLQDGGTTAWQYVAGRDTMDVVRIAGPSPRLYVEVREAGRRVGTVETRFGPDGLPATARLIVPSGPARLDLTFNSNVKAKPFAPDTWTPPEP
jgi:hypothetical protein